MRRSVRILRRAQFDLLEIQRYTERDRPAAATEFVEQLLVSIESLEQHSDRGPVPRDPRLAALRFRFVVHGEYLLFYEVLRTQVRVYRVLHGSRKYAHML